MVRINWDPFAGVIGIVHEGDVGGSRGVKVSTGDVVHGEFNDNFMRAGLEAVILSMSPAELLLGYPLSKQTEKGAEPSLFHLDVLEAYAGPASNVRVERTSRDCFSDGGALAEVMSLYENLSEDSRADHQVDNTEVMEQENHCLAIESPLGGYGDYCCVFTKLYAFQGLRFQDSPIVPNSPLQGETQVEELNWMMASRGEMTSRLEIENGEIESQMHNAYNRVELRNEGNEAPKNGEAENEELVNDEPKTTKPPHFQVPEDSHPRNISEVSTLTTSLQTNVLETPVGYALPFRHNCGKPPNRYSPDEEERRSVEEALLNPKWTEVPLHQLNIKNAFLHGDLEEEVYMDIPFRYATSSKTKIVCKLEQVLYGLKQSPRAWFGNFSSTIRKYGYHQSNSDHTFFQKHQGKVTTLIVYVDDMIITRDDVEEISRLQEHLATEFEMKNLGAKVFSRNRDVGLLECKLVDTPIAQNHRLGEYLDQVPADKERYQRLVGKLIYLSHTRLDIAYTISVSSPRKRLMFSKNNHLNIEGYTDMDWARNILDMKSTLEVGFAPSFAMNLLCDNKAAIDIAHNLVQHDRTKHIELD
ncbi:DNA mismatch repair protein MSH3 [Vitis vinifera]|uniref:DNA mismatch repair protein MSH3 n=1 Tax=Vitis vinifera TaxID=29760 RepID=A0A438GQH3_VITVI|nr:DNA mismatch repair protein MSH3 [Vitis vinifera]